MTQSAVVPTQLECVTVFRFDAFVGVLYWVDCHIRNSQPLSLSASQLRMPATPPLAQGVDYLGRQRQGVVYKPPKHRRRLPALPRKPVGKVLTRDLRELLGAQT